MFAGSGFDPSDSGFRGCLSEPKIRLVIGLLLDSELSIGASLVPIKRQQTLTSWFNLHLDSSQLLFSVAD